MNEWIRSGVIRPDDQISTDKVAWLPVRDFANTLIDKAGSPGAGKAPRQDSPWAATGDLLAPRPVAGQGRGDADLEFSSRDRIVILGRRAAGKTIYLSTLYARLWRSLDGMTMTALSGITHREAMRVVDNLAQGRWPPATTENAQMAFEIEYAGRKRIMISMDYSGEVFKRAFIEDGDSSREVGELLDHIDKAAGVMLLVDPSMAYDFSGDIDAATDDDYGMVKAVKRIRSRPGGENVPICLVLTKMDINTPTVQAAGSMSEFVGNQWPALARTLNPFTIFAVSAVQAERSPTGALVPLASSDPVHIEDPLNYCLCEIERAERELKQAELAAERARARQQEQRKLALEERRYRMFWAMVTVGAFLLAAFVIAAVVVFR